MRRQNKVDRKKKFSIFQGEGWLHRAVGGSGVRIFHRSQVSRILNVDTQGGEENSPTDMESSTSIWLTSGEEESRHWRLSHQLESEIRSREKFFLCFLTYLKFSQVFPSFSKFCLFPRSRAQAGQAWQQDGQQPEAGQSGPWRCVGGTKRRLWSEQVKINCFCLCRVNLQYIHIPAPIQ